MCGAAAQLPDDEYYPYGTGYEQRTPIVLTDSSLFYRAIQTMPDLYGSISAFNLPYIALGRRGQHYSSEAASFSGLGISSRYFGSLRLLGAREERRAGIAALPEAIGGAGGVRTFRFPGALAEPSCHASVSFTDRNYLAGAKLAYARPAGRGWDVAAVVEARTGRDMHVEGVFTNALTAGFRAARHLGEGHTLGFLLIVPPSVRGTRLSSVEEAFRLTGDNLYNPAWGFQDGKVRNSRVRREFVPLAGRYVLRAAVARDLARHGCRGRIRGAEIQRPGVVRRPYAHARQLPLPARLYGRPGNRTGMAVERRALYAGLLGRADRPQPAWAGGHAVYTLEDRARTYPQPRFRRPIYDRAGRAADAPLRLFLPPCPHAQLQTDARPCWGRIISPTSTSTSWTTTPTATSCKTTCAIPAGTVREGDRFGYDYALSTREATVRLSAEYRSDRLRATSPSRWAMPSCAPRVL